MKGEVVSLGCSSALQFLKIVSTSGMDLELVLDSVVFTLHFGTQYFSAGSWSTQLNQWIPSAVMEMTAFQGVRRVKAL